MAMLRLIGRADIGLAVLPEVVEAGHLPGLHEIVFAVTTPRRFSNPLVATLVRKGAPA